MNKVIFNFRLLIVFTFMASTFSCSKTHYKAIPNIGGSDIHFIKELKYVNRDKSDWIELDLSFQWKEAFVSRKVYFSHFSLDKDKPEINSIELEGGWKITDLETVFVRREKEQFQIRYFGEFSDEVEMDKLLPQPLDHILVNNIIYEPSSKTQKEIKEIIDNLWFHPH